MIWQMIWRKIIFAAASIACIGLAQAGDEVVMLNFVNADIETVVKAVGKITQRNFLIDPRVKGTVNIISGRPVPAPLTYQILLSALRLQGFTAVESKGVTLILPEADAKQHGVPVESKAKPARGSGLTTEVFILKHESAAQLLPVLRPLVAPNNPVTTLPGSNAIVVTDYADNLERIAQIIESIDQPPSGESLVIPVRYMPAAEMATLMTRMLNDVPAANTDAGQRVSVVADTRTNSLVIRSANPARLTQTRALVDRLDVPQSAPGNIHVVFLRNADAVKLAQTLRAIYNIDSGGYGAAGALPQTVPQAQQGLPTAQPGATGQPPGLVAGNATGPGFIQADAATNALIITAPDAIFNNLKTVIEKLDTRRAQVHVEAIIAEVTSDKMNELGIQWLGINQTANSNTQFGTNYTTNNNILGLLSSATTGTTGTTGTTTTTGTSTTGSTTGTSSSPYTPGFNLGIVNRHFAVLAHALQNDGVTNILSTPNLLTLGNEEARIVIGQNVPFITGQYAQSAGGTTPTPFQTIERRDVGISLKVKPQITEGGTVRLLVSQEVSSVDETKSNSAGIITNKRSLDSTVLLSDGQTIVLGGLIQDSLSDGQQKVPVLGDIPILGNLFSYSSKRRTKTNLMVFLRPTIVRDANVPSQLTSDRYNYIIDASGGAESVGQRLPNFAPSPVVTPAPAPALAPAPAQ